MITHPRALSCAQGTVGLPLFVDGSRHLLSAYCVPGFSNISFNSQKKSQKTWQSVVYEIANFVWINLILLPSFANIITLSFKMKLRLREVERMI